MKIQNHLPIQKPTGDQDKKIMEAAKMYEQQFMQEMQKAMNKTVVPTEKRSMAQEVFKGQLDQQYLQQWSDSGGVGLADLIYSQIKERYFGAGNGGAIKAPGAMPLPRPQGPLPTNPKTVVPQADDKGLNFKIEAESKSGANGQDLSQVTSPWDGVVKNKSRVGNINLLTLQHEGGINSRVAFSGPPSAISEGESVAAGAPIGQLNAGEDQIQWRVAQLNVARG
jgi:Rod binding domain-containing protein